MTSHDPSAYGDLSVLQLAELLHDRDLTRTEAGTFRAAVLMALKWAKHQEKRSLVSQLEAAKEAVTVTPERVAYETGEV